MVRNRITKFGLPLWTYAVDDDTRPKSSGALPADLEALFQKKPRTRELLRELLFVPADGDDRRDDAQRRFDQRCTEVITKLLGTQNPDTYESIFADFIKEVKTAIKAKPQLQGSFQNFLFVNLCANGADIAANDVLITRVAIASAKYTWGLLYMLMTREPGALQASDRFIRICKEHKLVRDLEIMQLLNAYITSKNSDEKTASIFVNNLINASNNPGRIKELLGVILQKEIENSEDKIIKLINSYEQPESNTDSYDAGIVTEDEPEVEQLSVDNLLAEVLESSVRVIACQNLLLELYRNLPDKKSLTTKEISKLVRSINFDNTDLEDLDMLQEEDLDKDEMDFDICNLSDAELSGRIFRFCENIVNSGETQYTQKAFIKDLKYLIKHNLEFNDLRIDRITVCLYYLLDQDPEACKNYVAKKLTQEQEQEVGWYFDDDLRKDFFSILGISDQRLINIIINEANDPDPGACPNLILMFQLAHNTKGKAHPLLEKVLNNTELDFENLMDKLPAIMGKASKSSVDFFDCKNIICRQFNWAEHSVISSRMEEFIIRQQGGEVLDITRIPDGEYHQWLKYIYEHPHGKFDVSKN